MVFLCDHNSQCHDNILAMLLWHKILCTFHVRLVNWSISCQYKKILWLTVIRREGFADSVCLWLISFQPTIRALSRGKLR